MTDNLDHLLSQPLADVPDSGFAARMAVLVEVERLRRERLKTEIAAGLVILAVLTLPFTGLGQVLTHSLFTLTGAVLAGVLLGVAILFQEKLPRLFRRDTLSTL